MIILKDKKDIKFAPEDFLQDYEWESHGQYDSLNFVNPKVTVLSVDKLPSLALTVNFKELP